MKLRICVQKLTFLGFVMDSTKMRVTLTPQKTLNLKKSCLHTLNTQSLQSEGSTVAHLVNRHFGV